MDRNKLNNSLSNLVYLTRSEHSRLHATGKHHSVETKQKMSASHKCKTSSNKGKKLYEEHKSKIRANNIGMLGKHHSAETREKMSAAKKGKHRSEETKQKIRIAKLGKKRSPFSVETREKMSAARRGVKWWNNGIKNVRAKECPERICSWTTKKINIIYIL